MAKDLAKQVASRMLTHALRTTTSAVKKVGRGTAVKHPKEQHTPKFDASKIAPMSHGGMLKPPHREGVRADEQVNLANKIKQQFGNVHATVGSSKPSVISRATDGLLNRRANANSRRNATNYAPEHEEEGPVDPWRHPASALSRIQSKKPRKETYAGGMTRKQRVGEQKVHAKEHYDKPLADRAAGAAAERHHQGLNTRIGGMTSRTITMPEAKQGFKKFIEARKKLGGHAPATSTQSPSVKLHLGPAMERQNTRFKKKSWGVVEFMKSKRKSVKSEKGKKKIHKVMHEFKHGELKSGSKHGPKVSDRKQAIAIALSEARAQKSFLVKGKQKNRLVGQTRAALGGTKRMAKDFVNENKDAMMDLHSAVPYLSKKKQKASVMHQQGAAYKTPEERRAAFKKIDGNKSFMGIVEFIKSKKSMKPGGGGRFAKFTKKLRAEGKSPKAAKAIAASAGRKKYGKKKMGKFSAKGRERAAKSWSGIVEFIKGRRKRTLKAGRVRGARLSSGTYRQTAPSVKRSVRAKLHAPTTAKRKNKGLAPVEKSKKRRRRRPDDYRAESKYDRELTRYADGDQEHPLDENEGIMHSPTEPERARGKYEKRRYELQYEA